MDTLLRGVEGGAAGVHRFGTDDLDARPGAGGAARPAPGPGSAGTGTGKAWYLPSGGSTGLPGFVPVPGSPVEQLRSQQGLLRAMRWRPDCTQLVMGPLHHAAPFTCAMTGLFSGNHVVVVHRFDLNAVRDAVRRLPPQWCQTTPHQMAVLAADRALSGALSTHLEGLMHTAAPCPADTKRAWIDLLGPERVFELYGSTQMVGAVIGDGPGWLKHPGAVGKPYMTQVRILDPDGRALPAGEVGEVYMRTGATRRLDPARAGHLRLRPGGFVSVGDLGFLDEDGYLHLTDRVDDVIIVGGANVSAREIENTLLGHPAVREALVVARPHKLLGQVPHAVVVATDPGARPAVADLRRHCRDSLEAYKVPGSIEFTDEFKRSRAGKIQRYAYRVGEETAR
jgi:bile acid-coenzyme A ligase